MGWLDSIREYMALVLQAKDPSKILGIPCGPLSTEQSDPWV